LTLEPPQRFSKHGSPVDAVNDRHDQPRYHKAADHDFRGDGSDVSVNQ
jgi:hypothetical protein